MDRASGDSFQFGLATLFAVVTAIAVFATFPLMIIAVWLAFVTVAGVQYVRERANPAKQVDGRN